MENPNTWTWLEKLIHKYSCFDISSFCQARLIADGVMNDKEVDNTIELQELRSCMFEPIKGKIQDAIDIYEMDMEAGVVGHSLVMIIANKLRELMEAKNLMSIHD